MVIKSEDLSMSENEDESSPNGKKSPKEISSVSITTSRITRQSVSRNNPPSKRPKLEAPLTTSVSLATNVSSVSPPPPLPSTPNVSSVSSVLPSSVQQEAGSTLQETLATLISNLGELQPNQLAKLAGMLSKNLSNGSGNSAPAPQFKCDMCPASFHTQSDYFKHVTFSHESDCGICLKSFSTHALLEEHVQSEHPTDQQPPSKNTDERMTCPVCNDKFYDEVELQAHLYSHKQIFPCELCREVFGEHRNLELHLKAFHEQHRPHTCNMCTETFCTASELYKHISFKHDLDCTICNQPFTSAAALKAHIKHQHTFECCACAVQGTVKIFNTVESYDIHLSHFHKGMEFYKCIKCNKRYISLPEFQNHVMEAHQAKPPETPDNSESETKQLEEEEMKEKCQFCDTSFVSSAALLSHVREIHDNSCVYCETVCNNGGLEEHMSSIHSRKCDICNIVYREQYLILEHFTAVHPELTLTKCWLCEERFITAHDLIKHSRAKHCKELNLNSSDKTSQDDTKHPCKSCDEVLSSATELLTHNKLDHNPRCTVCKVQMSSARDLDLHISSQHCISCEDCSDRFSSKLMLRNHITTKHPEKEIFHCRICLEHFSNKPELAKHFSKHIPVSAGSKTTTGSAIKHYLGKLPGVPCKRPGGGGGGGMSCAICRTKFSSIPEYEEHVQSAHEKNFCSCDICSHCFVSETALHKHIEIYHENIVFYTCNKCPKKTLSKPELDKHISLLHKNDYEYTTCDVCQEKFTNQSDYFKHISFAHDTSSEGGVNKCTNCTASFASETALAEHQLTAHQKSKFFVCKMCGVKFTSYYRLSRHMKLEHKGNEYSCDVCNKSFSTVLALYRHQKSYHENELGVRICLTCGARLASQKLLQDHVAQHFSSSDLKCKQCNINFTSVPALKEHNLFHQRQEYRCIDCGKTFTTQTDLKVHVSVDHVGMVMCTVCEEAFQDEKTLEVHMKFQHSSESEKTYRCSDCGDCFPSSRELKVHVTLKHLCQSLTASGDGTPKYNCVDCSESFTEKQTLKAHIQSKHTSMLACKGCFMMFHSKEELSDHDCGYLTVQCKQCSMKLRNKPELEEHMISHISINVNKQYCTLCNQQFSSLSELESHECREKESGEEATRDAHIREDSTLKVSDLSTAELQLLLDTLTGGLGKAQNSPTKKPNSALNSSPGISTPLSTPSSTPVSTPICSTSSSSDGPIVSTPTSTGGKSKASPSKVPSTLAGIISSLFGPGMGGLSPQAVLEALSELPPAKVTELLTTLTVNQDMLTSLTGVSSLTGGSMSTRELDCLQSTREGIISSLATNPPKLPDSLVADKDVRMKTAELPAELPCPRCKDKFITKQALASHLQACAAPSDRPAQQTPNKTASKGSKPNLKLIHRQLFIAAQNIDVSLLNISQVETLIQVLASEDGIKSVPQARVVDLLDTIEKWVKKKEALEREMRKKAKLSQSPSASPKPTQNLPIPARNSPLPLSARNSPLPKDTVTSPRVSNTKSTTSYHDNTTTTNKNLSPVKPPSLTDCLPPQITAAILPAIKDEQTDLGLLTKICTGMGGCNVSLPESLSTHLSLAVTKSIQILRHPDSTNKSTLSELKAIIISILGDKSSSDNSIKQGIMNVLKRNYRARDLHGTTTVDLDTFVQYLVKAVLPGLGELSPNLLTLPFLLDLVLKNNKFVGHVTTSCSKTLSSVSETAVSTSSVSNNSTVASSS
ncbi:zinc finger protein 91-like isoform X2 [Bolinopsis microptera]|uniref:zinc finger protein 91-like isoform X2 n=1 Tax=Bolinopsis microptera TaxID=2820187 RepID=UPI00307AF7F6